MRVAQEKVEQFMEMIGDHIAEKPEVGNLEDGKRRYKLMREELDEYDKALESGDLVAIADAIADLEYTVLGTSSHHGMALEPLFEEVHRSNMTKEKCVGNGFKLCKKGDAFEPPKLAELLLLQTTGLADTVQL